MHNNLRSGHSNNQRVNANFDMLEEFIRVLSNKQNGKEEIAYAIMDFQKDVIFTYIKSLHMQRFNEPKQKLFKRLNTSRVAKAFKYVLKKEDVYSDGLDIGWGVIFADFINASVSNEESECNDEAVAIYGDLITKILKGRIKEIGKKADIPDEAILELLVVAPGIDYISNPKFIGTYINQIMNRMFVLVENKGVVIDSVDTVKELFKGIFGKEPLSAIGISILLARKESEKGLSKKQKALWQLLTDFALYIVNKRKKEIEEALTFYCSRRYGDERNDRDSERRVVLSSYLKDKQELYPNLYEVVMEMKENERYMKYL